MTSVHSVSLPHFAWRTPVPRISLITTKDFFHESIQIVCESTPAITIRRICGTVDVSWVCEAVDSSEIQLAQ